MSRLAYLVAVAVPYIGTRADELCRNLAGAEPGDVTLAEMADAIERRREHFGLQLADGDVGPLAEALFAVLATEQVAA